MDYLVPITIFSIGMLALICIIYSIKDNGKNTSNKSSHKSHTLEFTDEEIIKLKILAKEQPNLIYSSPFEKFKKNRDKMKKHKEYNKPNISGLV